MVAISSRRVDTGMKSRTVPFTLDRLSPLPLHYQLQQHLRDAIASGVYGLGDSIPPEPDLAVQLHVSRFTVRQAIDNLVRDGMLSRQRGRGTFVIALTGQAAQSDGTQIIGASSIRGLGTEVRVLAVQETGNGSCIKRVRLMDDEPVMIETITLPDVQLADVGDGSLDDRAIGRLIEQQRRMAVSRAEETVRVVRLDADSAGELGVRTGSPGLQIERRSYAGHDLAELREMRLAGDRFQLSGATIMGNVVANA